MTNYLHKNILDKVNKLDEIPENKEDFDEWVNSTENIRFLIQNALTDEIALYISSEFLYIDSLVVTNNDLFPLDKDDLLHWGLSSIHSIASYVIGGGRDDIWIERGFTNAQSKSLEGAKRLIFRRTFEGFSGDSRNYFEILQEYTHLCEIHWRPERHAYCDFDENGDFNPVVTISKRDNNGIDLDIVTFQWESLEEYLVVSDSSLIRFFDFTLYKPREFSDWPHKPEKVINRPKNLFYRQLINPGNSSYTRGFQVIQPRRSKKEVFLNIKNKWFGGGAREYAEFIAYDWRNGVITKISTDPEKTSNYFNSEGNSKPFEVSPAFFNPEVLSKYKADKEKYTIDERQITCRGSWYLKGIDVNDAGQIHTYICYLRDLPYKEQLHWLSHNEEPKANISERAYLSDFKAEWVQVSSSFQKILQIIERWQSEGCVWWKIRNLNLLKDLSQPLTDSRDEWAESFMDLSKLIIEGFQVKIIREKLDKLLINYEENEKSIVLLEKIINSNNTQSEERKLEGLRTVQLIRSKVKGHSSGSEAEQLADNALKDHGSFREHFQFVCSLLVDELQLIEKIFSNEVVSN
ncbi:hypothetical protein [Pelolinea submarina]|uniref:Uncharacterized protein n=1 Tax=Pelolinea submarina TaxID=913107 RepID=A0A347ZUA0_9CHLR|nr:hypothetical protein [Pelolinea submarina]REG10534.1 hypothetical protein DFR64_0393 [Pelolinea submarina]BBB48881.1 hypothetical protein Pelsub_P2112 [Pelolinea submarina]